MPSPLSICYAAAEVAPFAKTGGLADVSAALPRQLHRMGHDVRVFMPLYGMVDREGHALQRVESIHDVAVRLGSTDYAFSLWTAALAEDGPAIYFVDCPELYRRAQIYTSDADEAQRFTLFTRAVIESCQRMGWGPRLFHCHDWHTALIPLMLKTVYEWDELFRASHTLLTIHNIGYQGVFRGSVIRELGLGDWPHLFDQGDLGADRVNLLRTGLLHADLLTTVSPTYAREIQTDDYGMGLAPLLRARRDALVGILNGVDYDEWSPEKDRLIPHRYSRKRLEGKAKNKSYLLDSMGLRRAEPVPLLGTVSRLVEHKGFDLCVEVLPELLANHDLRLVVLGTGERRYEEFFSRLHKTFAGKAAFYRGHNDELAHLIEAGADMLIMPSRYEPCGLNQMFSLRYGTIPVVRNTGGLADTVRPFDAATGEGTGFMFEHYTPAGLRWAIETALRTYQDRAAWNRLMANAMVQNFSWKIQAERYVEVYSRLLVE